MEVKMICNKCGKELDIYDKMEDFKLHKPKIGYGSKYDCDELRLNLCCDCMDAFIDSCAVSPIIEHEYDYSQIPLPIDITTENVDEECVNKYGTFRSNIIPWYDDTDTHICVPAEVFEIDTYLNKISQNLSKLLSGIARTASDCSKTPEERIIDIQKHIGNFAEPLVITSYTKTGEKNEV